MEILKKINYWYGDKELPRIADAFYSLPSEKARLKFMEKLKQEIKAAVKSGADINLLSKLKRWISAESEMLRPGNQVVEAITRKNRLEDYKADHLTRRDRLEVVSDDVQLTVGQIVMLRGESKTQRGKYFNWIAPGKKPIIYEDGHRKRSDTYIRLRTLLGGRVLAGDLKKYIAIFECKDQDQLKKCIAIYEGKDKDQE